jgi:hypothetical protein
MNGFRRRKPLLASQKKIIKERVEEIRYLQVRGMKRQRYPSFVEETASMRPIEYRVRRYKEEAW